MKKYLILLAIFLFTSLSFAGSEAPALRVGTFAPIASFDSSTIHGYGFEGSLVAWPHEVGARAELFDETALQWDMQGFYQIHFANIGGGPSLFAGVNLGFAVDNFDEKTFILGPSLGIDAYTWGLITIRAEGFYSRWTEFDLNEFGVRLGVSVHFPVVDLD